MLNLSYQKALCLLHEKLGHSYTGTLHSVKHIIQLIGILFCEDDTTLA